MSPTGVPLCGVCGSDGPCVHQPAHWTPTSVEVPASIALNPEFAHGPSTHLIGGIRKIQLHHSKQHSFEMEVRFFETYWPSIRFPIPQDAYNRIKAESELHGLCRKES